MKRITYTIEQEQDFIFDILNTLYLFLFQNSLHSIREEAMGIHTLAKLIADQAPGAIKEGEIKNYFGRKIAIDA